MFNATCFGSLVCSLLLALACASASSGPGEDAAQDTRDITWLDVVLADVVADAAPHADMTEVAEDLSAPDLPDVVAFELVEDVEDVEVLEVDVDVAPECVDDGACDDGAPCTLDHCEDGACAHEIDLSIPGCCAQDEDCDDGDPCTDDSCDLEVWACASQAVAGVCDDGDPCTVDDMCAAGACVGAPRDCDDGDACTA